MNEKTELYDLGFKTGLKLQGERAWVSTAIHKITDNTHNPLVVRELIAKCCMTTQEPVPSFAVETDEYIKDNWVQVTAYFTGLWNGTIHK